MAWARHGNLAVVSAIACMAASLPGCSEGNAVLLHQVRGTVAHRGKLLDHGRVVFLPDQGPPAVGEIQPDGSFRLQTEGKAGAMPGRNHVLVQCRENPPPSAKPNLNLRKSLIPEKYSGESSPLYFEVKSGENEYPISLE